MRGPIPFWFKNMWMKEEGFKDLVKSCCQGLRFGGSSSFILVEKLKALRPLTETWHKEIFGKVEENKKSA